MWGHAFSPPVAMALTYDSRTRYRVPQPFSYYTWPGVGVCHAGFHVVPMSSAQPMATMIPNVVRGPGAQPRVEPVPVSSAEDP